jgi:cytidylate kinase
MSDIDIANKKHIISIAGKPGSGKSTTAELVASQLGFKRYSTGDMFRELSKARGLDVLAGNKHAEDDRSIDDAVDDRQTGLGLKENQFVIDARLAWHFIPSSFKVYLDLDSLTAARRITSQPSQTRAEQEHIHDNFELYAIDLNERLASESKRYMSLYGVNPADPKNYDLVVDTSSHTPDEVARLVFDSFQKWITN